MWYRHDHGLKSIHFSYFSLVVGNIEYLLPWHDLILDLGLQPGGNLDTLKPDDVEPHLVFHNGIPSGANLLAYDSIQKILAIATR